MRRYLCSYFCGSVTRAGILVRLHLCSCVHSYLASQRIPYHHKVWPSDKLGMLELALKKNEVNGYSPLLHTREINGGLALMAKRITFHPGVCCYFHILLLKFYCTLCAVGISTDG